MSSLTKSAALPAAQNEAVRYGVPAMLPGVIFIGVAGFAPLQAIHDAAHNTRHAIAFPCRRMTSATRKWNRVPLPTLNGEIE